MIQQQAGEAVVPPETDAVWLRDHTTEQRGVAAEAVGVNRGPGVHIGAARDQPARDFDLIIIDT
jgi:hypothetical protein